MCPLTSNKLGQSFTQHYHGTTKLALQTMQILYWDSPCVHYLDQTSFSTFSLAQWCPPLLRRQDMEQQLGSLILATDISRQNEFLTTFREHLDNQDLDLHLAAHRHFILQVQQRHPQSCQVNTAHRVFYLHLQCASRLPSSAQMCATRAACGSWAASGAKGCVRSSTGRVGQRHKL